jgi:hypothetical protein
MLFPRWLRTWLKKVHTPRLVRHPSRRPVPPKRVLLEPLEERILLSVVFSPGPYLTPTNLTDVVHSPLTIPGFGPLEPQITVNPTNPANLALSQQRALQVSNDDTGTYTPAASTTFPEPFTSSAGDTSTAYDGQGRLFWANLSDTTGTLSVYVTQLNPATGAQIGTTHLVSTPPAGSSDDKEFLVADPKTNDLYIAWTRFSSSSSVNTILLSRSTDQGVTWSTPVTVGTGNNSTGTGEGYDWPATLSVGPDDTIYVAYHSTPGTSDTNGQVFVARYNSDLSTQISKTNAFTSGNADIRGFYSTNYPGVVFKTIGTGESYVMADPTRPGNIYVIALNDPNDGGAGDAGDVVFAKSTDFGATWSTSVVDTHPANATGYDLFPTASIDQFGDIVVTWYENDAGTNGAGNSLLDVYATYSTNGGVSFASPFKVSDTALDPDSDARIDDYMGNSIFGGTAYAVWEGDGGSSANTRQVTTDAIAINGSLTVNGDNGGGPVNDNFILQQIAGNPGYIQITDNGVVEYAGLLAGVAGGIQFNGLAGNDTLTVDFSNGNPIPTGGIDFDGGTGFDSMTLQGGAETAESYSPGPNPGSGTIQITAGATAGPATAGTIHFENLSPVFDMTPGPLTVNGTNAANAINYNEGSATVADYTANPRVFNPAWGEVSVDNNEPMEFTNKTTLTINSLPGNDIINLNNPFTPMGVTNTLTGITVNGGPPAAGSDTLIVNANTTAGAGINFAPTSATAGTITGTGVGGASPGVPITFSNIAQVEINGQNEDDNLTVTTPTNPAIANIVNLTPGALPDAGTVTLRQSVGSGGSPLVGLDFVNLGTNNNAGRLSFANGGGRVDSLTINGVANASEIFTVSSAGNIDLAQPTATAGVANRLLLDVATLGVAQLQLVGLSQNDTFNVAGNNPFTGVFVDGDPGTLNFTGDGTAAVTADLGASTVTETGFGPVGYTGVGTVNIDAGGAALTIDGTAGDDNLTYTPTGTGTQGAGTVTDAGLPTTVNFNGVTGTFTLDPLGGDNTVTVNGTDTNDTINVVRGATTTVQVNALQTVSLVTADTQALVIDTGLGTDTVNVSGTSGPAALTVNGGADPRADTLNITNTSTGTTTVTPGQTPDAGTVAAPGTDGSVAFTGMSSVSVTAAAATDTITAIGPNGNDTLFLQHLPAVVGPGTDRFWVNNQAPTIFSGFGTVVLHGLFGNDQFNVNPVGLLPAVTAITVTGTSDGNSLTVNGSAAADAINFAPTGPAAGSVAITGSATTAFTAIQGVTINGQGGGDTLTVTTPAAATATFNPGATTDSGSVQVNSLVPMSYTNLGAGGVTLSDAGGTFVYNGTAGNDTFTVAATTGAVSLNSQLAITPLGGNIPSTLTLNGLEGLNTFNVAAPVPYTTTTLASNDTTATDPVNLTGNGGTGGSAATVTLGATSQVTGAGLGTVNLPGDAVLNLTNAVAGAGDIVIDGPAAGGNAFTVTPTGTTTATIAAAGLSPVVNTTNPGLLLLDPGAGGNNTVTVNGTPASDNIDVARGSPDTTVTVDALRPVSLVTADTQALVIATGNGIDTVTVTGAGAKGTRLSVLGASPLAPDTLLIHNATPGTTLVVPSGGPEAGSVYTPDGTIAYSGMEKVELFAATASDTLQFNGTNVSVLIEFVDVGGTDVVELDNLGVLPFFGFNNLDIVGAYGNNQLLVTSLPGINVNVISSGGQDLGGGFFNTVNFDPGTASGTVLPHSINIPGAPPVSLNGLTLVNFLNGVMDVSALIKLLFASKPKRIGHNRIRIQYTVMDLSALALGGPLLLILADLTGKAQVVGVDGYTGRPATPGGIGQPWIGVREGSVPVIYPGQEIRITIDFKTTHSNVSFLPFFVIASNLP